MTEVLDIFGVVLGVIWLVLLVGGAVVMFASFMMDDNITIGAKAGIVLIAVTGAYILIRLYML